MAAPTLWADTPPTVTLVNQNITVRAGEEVRFEASISGPGDISVQWYRQGQPVAGGGDAELVIAHVLETDAGIYQVVAENEFGSTLGGGRIELSVGPAVEFGRHPESVAVRHGQPLTLQAQAEGIGVVMHWLRGNVMLPAEPDGSLFIPAVSFTDGGIYQAVGVGTYGVGKSDRVRVAVLPSSDPGVMQLDPSWEIPVERALSRVHAVVALRDGGIVIAGEFMRINGHDTSGLVKMTASGDVDPTFAAEVTFAGSVASIDELPNGQLMLGGPFYANYPGGNTRGMMRVNSDGSVDPGFSLPERERVDVQNFKTDGTGALYFLTFPDDGVFPDHEFRRLNPDGSLDPGFFRQVSRYASGFTFAVAADGKVFTAYQRFSGDVPSIRRLTDSGQIDQEFEAPEFSSILFMDFDPLGRLLMGGRLAGGQGFGWARYSMAGERDQSFAQGGGLSIFDPSFTITPDGGLFIVDTWAMNRVGPDGNLLESPSFPTSGGVFNRSDATVDASGRPVYVRSDDTLGRPLLDVGRFSSDYLQHENLVTSSVSAGSVAGVFPRSDDQYLVLGDFNSIGGVSRNNAAVVTAEGLIAEEVLEIPIDGPILHARRDSEGNILAAGGYQIAAGQREAGLVKLSPDGDVFPRPDPAVFTIGIDGAPNIGLLPLTDGSVLVRGRLRVSAETTVYTYVSRFAPSGTLDLSFLSQAETWSNSYPPSKMVELLDGRIFIPTGFRSRNTSGNLEYMNIDGSRSENGQTAPNLHQTLLAIGPNLQDEVWLIGDGGIQQFDLSDGSSTVSAPAMTDLFSTEDSAQLELIPAREGGILAFGSLGFRNDESSPERRFAVRLFADGSVDESFEIKGLHETVQAVLPLEDGHFILACSGRLHRTVPLQRPRVSLSAPVQLSADAPVRLVANVTGHADSFQWYRNGTPIPGETGSVLEIAEPQANDAGFYAVVARNAEGAGASQIEGLTVLDDRSHAGGFHRAAFPVANAGVDTIMRVEGRVMFTDTPSEIAWSVLLPEGWALTPFDSDSADAFPAELTTGLAEWKWQNPTAGRLQIYYDMIPPENASGRWEFPAMVTVSRDGEEIESMANPDPVIFWLFGRSRHAADINDDRSIDLSELLRVIELYNTRSGTTRTGRYRINARSADGFDADLEDGALGEVTVFHSADTDVDATISLSELLRVIELYNVRSGTSRTGRYRVDEATLDGFAPDLN